jgi:hypothetical protein
MCIIAAFTKIDDEGSIVKNPFPFFCARHVLESSAVRKDKGCQTF